MSLKEIQKEYEKYFDDFSSAQKEFELSAIEIDKWDFLKAFCRVSASYLDKLMRYVTPLFIPGSWYSSVVMNSVKDKTLVEEAKVLYREMMVLYHEALKAELKSEKEQIAYLHTFLEKYSIYKERALRFLDICEHAFHEQREKKSETRGYLG